MKKIIENKLSGLVAVLFALQGLIAAPRAAAAAIGEVGDWYLDDSNPSNRESGQCTAYTAGMLNDTAYTLLVVLDKSGTAPLQILIEPSTQGASGAKGFRTQLENGTDLIFSKLPRSNSGDDLFWHVPRSTDAVISELKRLNQFTLEESSGQGVLPFSLSGSTSILTQLQQKCANSKTLFSTSEFEKSFLPSSMARVSLAKLTPALTSKAKDLIRSGVVAFRGVQAVNEELRQLEARYAKLNQELAELKSRLNFLINTELVRLNSEKTDAEQIISKSQLEIDELKVQISNQENQVAAAQAAFDDATKTIAPFLPEHDRLLRILQQSESELQNSKQSLSQTEQKILRDQQEIGRLNSEVANNRQQLDQLMPQARQAYDEAVRASQSLQQFDPRREFESRARSDQRIQSLSRDIQFLQNQQQNQTQQVQIAQSLRDQKANALQQCLAVGGAPAPTPAPPQVNPNEGQNNHERGGVGRDRGPGGGGGGGPGGGPGSGPGRPGRPEQPPQNPTPVPTPASPTTPDNCTNQGLDLAQADAQLNNAKRSLEQISQMQNQKRNELEMVRNQIMRQVQDQHEQLRRWDESARSRSLQLNRQIEILNFRQNQIYQIELPNAQNDLQNMLAQLPGAQSRLANATAARSLAEQNWLSYKAQVNFDFLQNNVIQTRNNLNDRKNELAQQKQAVLMRENLIQTKTNLRNNLVAKIAQTGTEILQKQNRQQEVEALLLPYNSEKSVVLQKLAAAQDKLSQVTVQFDNTLPKR